MNRAKRNTKQGITVVTLIIIIAIAGVAYLYLGGSVPLGEKKDATVGAIAAEDAAALSNISYPAIELFVPQKMVQGYRLSEGSPSGKRQPNGVHMYRVIFRDGDGTGRDRLYISQFPFESVLASQGETRESFLADARTSLTIDNKTVYLTKTDIFTQSSGEKYAVSAFAEYGDTIVRIEYLAEQKIADEELAELAASFVPVD